MLHDYNKRCSLEKLYETLRKIENDRRCNVVQRNRLYDRHLQNAIDGHNGKIMENIFTF